MNISDSSSGSSSATTTSSLSSSGPSFRPHHRWAVIGGELSRDRGNRLWLVDSDLIYRRLMDVVFSAASLPADSPVNTDPGAKQQIQVMTRLWREGGLVNCNEIPLGSSESGVFSKSCFYFVCFHYSIWQFDSYSLTSFGIDIQNWYCHCHLDTLPPHIVLDQKYIFYSEQHQKSSSQQQQYHFMSSKNVNFFQNSDDQSYPHEVKKCTSVVIFQKKYILSVSRQNDQVKVRWPGGRRHDVQNWFVRVVVEKWEVPSIALIKIIYSHRIILMRGRGCWPCAVFIVLLYIISTLCLSK